MACPHCNDSGQVLVGVVPRGAHGNPSEIPVFETCGCGAAELQQRYQQQIREASNRRRLEEEQALEAATAHMTELAGELSRRGSPGCVERVVHVATKGWGPFKTEHYDVYEPAWPVPEQLFDLPEGAWTGGGKERLPTGITRHGNLVPLLRELSNEEPVVRSVIRSYVAGSGIRTVQSNVPDLNAVIWSLQQRLTTY